MVNPSLKQCFKSIDICIFPCIFVFDISLHPSFVKFKILWTGNAGMFEFRIFQSIVSCKQVIVCTLTNNSLRFLREQGFRPNLTIIDEAAQALECVAWYALLLSPRAVIVGDPWQLPPVLKTSRCSSMFNSTFRILKSFLVEVVTLLSEIL